MKRFLKDLGGFLLAWFSLRVLEFVFVLLIGFLWLFLFQDYAQKFSLGDVLNEAKSILRIWAVFSIAFLYWPASVLFSISAKILSKGHNASFVNAAFFMLYSLAVDLFLILSADTMSLIIGFWFIWAGIIIFDYYSPKILPRKLRNFLTSM